MASTRWTPKGDDTLFDRVIPEPRWSYAVCRLELYEAIDPPLLEVLKFAAQADKLDG